MRNSRKSYLTFNLILSTVKQRSFLGARLKMTNLIFCKCKIWTLDYAVTINWQKKVLLGQFDNSASAMLATP